MANYPISNVSRRVVYTGSAGVGPYAFSFEIINSGDVDVYKNDALLTLTTNYTVTINANGTGTVTLVVAATGADRITIVGARTIERTTDFVTGGDLFANTLNEEIDSQTIFVQQVAETAERSIKAPVTDPTNINMTLPSQLSRAGKTLAFDSNGNPVVGEDIGNWRGNWAAATSYGVRDLVKDPVNMNIYRVNTAHVSSGSAPISSNADSAKWDLVLDASSAQLAADWAKKTDGIVESTDYSSKAWSIGGTGVTNTSSRGAAKEWATKTGGTVDGTEYSAKYYSQAAGTSATNASNSASAASTSATNASNSASSASTSATNASNSASAAATSETNAGSSASSASTSATNASNSAALAAASAAAGLYSSVIDKSANYTVVLGDAGALIRVTTTSGAITITLPAISTVVDGFKVAIVKWTGDSNGVSIVRSGSDTINGATSATIGSQYTSTTFVADFESNQWLSVSSGLGSTNVAVDQFSGNGSTVAFTLSGDAGSENNTQVFVSGVYQEKDTYSLSGTTLTFSAAPPTGTGNIEVVWTAPLSIGVPSDGTVTPAKMADVGVTAATYGSATEIPQIVVNAKGQITSATNVAVSGVPVGAVEMFAMNTAPSGWLKANGAAVSRTTYSALFSAIGTVFGAGNGSTTFNVPDLRGEFIRGWDDARGIDSGRAFGSAQTDLFKAHTHDAFGAGIASGNGVYIGGVALQNYYLSGIGTTGGAETRPRNIALLACIKF
jgi:phage-related tail fiber protein